MADYLIQDTTLTGIADAIRSKTGGSDPLAVSAFAGTIAALSTGGGGGAKVTSGTFKLDEDFTLTGNIGETSGVYEIAHGLGVMPDFFAVCAIGTGNNYGSPYSLRAQILMKHPSWEGYTNLWTSFAEANAATINSDVHKTGNVATEVGNSTVVRIGKISEGSYKNDFVISKTVTYTWVAVKFSE